MDRMFSKLDLDHNDIHKFCMDQAFLVADSSECKRAHVGAICADSTGIIGQAYNRPRYFQKTCEDDGCLMVDGHCMRTIHAEEWLCYYLGEDLERRVVYVTHFPCLRCVHRLLMYRVEQIIYYNDYGSKEMKDAVYEVVGQGKENPSNFLKDINDIIDYNRE